MKYLFLIGAPTYILIRCMPVILEHDELLKGLALFFLTALTGILLTALYWSFKTELTLRKKLGDEVYEWLSKEE